ncbi:hypothetical protein ACIQMR_20805 [Streptomyces sp. NPDC091376]|uniref:hypothetical protein n=1 Tax=Streptomyces sp. NPDC091376 TaxID=3365994 RepID=UPI003828CAE5
MLDTTPLTAAVERFADRLRAAPQSRLQRGAAAEGLALARELARRAQLIETPGAEPGIMPDAGIFAVADQLSVAGTDLAEAMRTGTASPEELGEAVECVEGAARRALL